MFTFDIKHVAGTKHRGPDTLSRRGKAKEDSEDEDPNDLEDQMDLDLSVAQAFPVEIHDDVEMPEEFRKVMTYLLTLQRPEGMSDRAFHTLKQYTLRFLVHEGLLFR